MIAESAISSQALPLLAFAGVAVIGLAGLWLFVSNAARQSELAERGGLELEPSRGPVKRLDTRLLRTRRGFETAARLRSAGVQRSVGEFTLIRIGIVLGAVVVTRLVVPLLLALACGVAAWWATHIWLQRRLDKRRDEFTVQLPEIARLLSNGASAGLSVPAGLELAVRELDDPARSELQTVIDELSLGASLEVALETLERRLPSREIAVLISCIVIQQRAGGDTVNALRELSQTLDTRRETSREVKTLMSGAIYTAYVVPFLGLASLLMLNTINRHTLQRLTTNAVGIVVLVVVAILYLVGFIAIKRVTRIEL